jgi:hypothetical protein
MGFLGQRDAGRRTVGLGDHPELGAEPGGVDRQQAAAEPQRILVGLPILVVHVTPITTDVPVEILRGVLLCGCECLNGPRCRHDLSQYEPLHVPPS